MIGVSQCQCHACVQQVGKNIATSLPQHIQTTPLPAALHLYPHIHGANNIAGESSVLYETLVQIYLSAERSDWFQELEFQTEIFQ